MDACGEWKVLAGDQSHTTSSSPPPSPEIRVSLGTGLIPRVAEDGAEFAVDVGRGFPSGMDLLTSMRGSRRPDGRESYSLCRGLGARYRRIKGGAGALT